MNPTPSLILILFINALDFESCSAMLNNESSPELNYVVSKVQELLESQFDREVFKYQMLLLARQTNNQFLDSEIKSLHLVFNAKANFNNPCNIDSIQTFKNAHIRCAHIRNPVLRHIMYGLCGDSPMKRYTDKCISEFDELAQQLYNLNEDIREPMSFVATLISQQNRQSMIHNKLVLDFVMTSRPNPRLEQLVFSEWDYCGNILSNLAVINFMTVMKKILDPVPSLRSPQLIQRLNDQIDSPLPNTIKLMSLAMFCDVVSFF